MLKEYGKSTMSDTQLHLTLYQNGKLYETLPYISVHHKDIRRRISETFRVMSKELLNIYHCTRNRQNSELYGLLPKEYKDALFSIHRIYIRHKQNIKDYRFSISISDVEQYLKDISLLSLETLIIRRVGLLQKLEKSQIDFSNIMIGDSIDIMVEAKLLGMLDRLTS